jgi:hypothetical protein
MTARKRPAPPKAQPKAGKPGKVTKAAKPAVKPAAKITPKAAGKPSKAAAKASPAAAKASPAAVSWPSRWLKSRRRAAS